jgi:hypothetical protein
LNEKYHLGEFGIDGRTTLKLILKKNMVLDRVQWWGLVDTAMNLRVPQNTKNALTG